MDAAGERQEVGGEGMVLMLMTWCRIIMGRVLVSPVTVLVCLFHDLSKFYVHVPRIEWRLRI